MPLDASSGIAAVGVFGGLLAGAVALFNSRKAVRWKRAELANSYMKDYGTPQFTTPDHIGISSRSDRRRLLALLLLDARPDATFRIVFGWCGERHANNQGGVASAHYPAELAAPNR